MEVALHIYRPAQVPQKVGTVLELVLHLPDLKSVTLNLGIFRLSNLNFAALASSKILDIHQQVIEPDHITEYNVYSTLGVDESDLDRPASAHLPAKDLLFRWTAKSGVEYITTEELFRLRLAEAVKVEP